MPADGRRVAARQLEGDDAAGAARRAVAVDLGAEGRQPLAGQRR